MYLWLVLHRSGKGLPTDGAADGELLHRLVHFGGKGDDDPVVLCVAYMSGWSSRGGFYTEEREFCVCSSQHPRARAPAAGNSSLTRIHLHHLVCKHSDGFIRLNLWCRRYLAFLICAWTSHLNCIVMSDNKMFPCCHSTFPVIGCFKNCYTICSCWNVAAVIWSKNS